MTSLKRLPPAMLADIGLYLEQNRGKCISIYPAAEAIRLRWEEENIALEDVVSALVERCGQHAVAVSFEPDPQLDVLVEGVVPGGDIRRIG